jgi:3-oxoacyl-[acyl-carrier-protein] synthase II
VELRRVVITGVGLVTPLGTGTEKNWSSLVEGRSGIGRIRRFDASSFPTRIAGEVTDFVPENCIEPKDIKRMDLFTQYALGAATEAIADARLTIPAEEAERVGVVIGVGLGGLSSIETYHKAFLEGGVKKISPFFVPRVISNLAPGQIAIRFGAKGANWTPTSACSSGAHAVGEAFRMIQRWDQDVMIAGGAEAGISPLGVGGFVAMKALSTKNDEPDRASRPFDKNRDGFVMGEGAGVLILEELERAKTRRSRIYAEIIGYGSNSDAYHITSPSPDGEGAARCMALALKSAGIQPHDIDYINAHGTSTEYNDANESQAIRTIFGKNAYGIAVSSTKSMTGHLLGAAGAVEAIYSVLTINRGLIPPTINYETPDPHCDLDYVPNHARRAEVRTVLSNSFGFGGTNATLILRKFVD